MGDKRRFLFFCPEGSVFPHFTATLVLARAMQDAGYEVVMAACQKALERCIAKDSMSLPVGATEHPALCAQCRSLAMAGISAYGIRYLLPLENILTPEHRQHVAELVDSYDGRPEDFTVDGVVLGRLALHDTTFVFKLLDSNLSEEVTAYLKEKLRSIVGLYITLKKAITQFDITDVVAYGQYGQNLGVAMAAQQAGARWSLIQNLAHLGADRRRVMVQYQRSTREMVRDVHRLWPLWKDVPLSPDAVKEIVTDSLFRLGATSIFTYSPARTGTAQDIRTQLGLSQDRRLLVAFSSSPDERVGAEDVRQSLGEAPLESAGNPFPDQITWLRWLADWMGTRDDLQLVIRIHPREDANARDGIRSAHFHKLQQALQQVPGNVRVIWPRDGVSSYDLMEVADTVLTSWSNIGMECARLGIPVLTYEQETGTFPVGDFIDVARSQDDYTRLVDDLLTRVPDLGRLRRAIRYYGLRVMGHSLFVGDVVPQTDQQSLPGYRTPAAIKEIEEVLCTGIPCAEYKLPAARKRVGDPVAERQETQALLGQFRRLVMFFMTNRQPEADYAWLVVETDADGLAAAKPPKDGGILVALTGNYCRFVSSEADVTRWSPLVARLARLSFP